MSDRVSAGTGFFRELQRRRVLRTAALYIVGAWLVVQVADVVFPGLGIPEQSIRYLLLAAVAGFPVALVFGWLFDIEDGGIRRTAPAGAEDLAHPQPLGRSDYVILLALAGVLGAISYGAVTRVMDTPESVREDTPRVASGDASLPMVAVLPFNFASMGGEGKFFAGGVHDDLLSKLAQLKSIRVISSKSVQEYRDSAKSIPEIAQELGADVVVEGGIQIAGSMMRLNAQIINAVTDENLWGNTYNRELTARNIFQVQTEISQAIATAVQVSLTADDSARLAVIPTDNLAAYRHYHEAMLTPTRSDERIELLKRALELDPEFTLAMRELVAKLTLNYFFYSAPELVGESEALIARIGELAPDSIDHLSAQSLYSYYVLRRYPEAVRLITLALDQAPSDTRLLEIKYTIQRRMGDSEGRTATARMLTLVDPNNPRWVGSLAGALLQQHRYDEAQQVLDGSRLETPNLQLMRNELWFREHGDFALYAAGVKSIDEEYGGKDESGFPLGEKLLEAYWYARDFAAARQLLESVDYYVNPKLPEDLSTNRQTYQLITYFLGGPRERFVEVLKATRETVSADEATLEDSKFRMGYLLDMAKFAALEGRTARTARIVKELKRELADDETTLSALYQNLCQMLGIAGAAEDAVECLRDAITEPSGARSFMEPKLPFYDNIRDHPAFVQLVADIETGAFEPGGQPAGN